MQHSPIDPATAQTIEEAVLSASQIDGLHAKWQKEYGVQSLPSVEEMDKLFEKARARLFFRKRAGFLGSLMCNHEYAWDLEAPTAWCNGSVIAFNPYFFMALTVDERITVLAHELWHTALDHMGRVKERDPKLWNIAADHVINNILADDGYSFGHCAGVTPACDPQFSGWSTEAVYDKLKKDQPPPNSGGGGISGFGKGNGNPNGGQKGLSGDLRDPDPNVIDKMQKIMAAANADQMTGGGGIGSLPGEIQAMIEAYLTPVVPWEVMLEQWLTEVSEDDYSWKRPSRRYEDDYLPSRRGENGLEHLVFAQDISGSMTDEELVRTNSEAAHVHETFRPEKFTVLTFDTKVQDTFEFDREDTYAAIEVHGRGGTDLKDLWKWIEKNEPTAVVLFSDLYVDIPKERPKTDIIWVAVANPAAKVPYGRLIHITRDEITGAKKAA